MFEYNYIIKDDGIVDNVLPDSNFLTQVYEVIRLIDGIPLFFDEHFKRFKASCEYSGLHVGISMETFALQLAELAQINKVKDCNVRYLINKYADRQIFYAGFVRSSYPTADMYRQGVAIDFLYEERTNPNAKVLNMNLREQADILMARDNLFEVALVNHHGKITEGSKSNLFFIDKEGVVHTAPLYLVLGGITRQIVLEEIVNGGIPLVEEAVDKSMAGSMAAGFISGTSPSVLPIARLGGIRLNPCHEILARIAKGYNKRMLADIDRFKAKYSG